MTINLTDRRKVNGSAFFANFSILKLVVTAGVAGVVVAAIALDIWGPKKAYDHFISAFIVFAILERLWETFYTSKEKKATEALEDWSISAVSFYYVAMMFFALFEFFIVGRTFNLLISLLGLGLLAISFGFRWWGMKTLGEQWAVHATGSSKLEDNKKYLIRSGPYEYVRHPIYFGVILELIAIPLIPNAFYTFGFVLLVNVPLQILRSKLEEQKLVDWYGYQYIDYMRSVNGLIPIRQNAVKNQFDRRKQQTDITFPNRRKSERRLYQLEPSNTPT